MRALDTKTKFKNRIFSRKEGIPPLPQSIQRKILNSLLEESTQRQVKHLCFQAVMSGSWFGQAKTMAAIILRFPSFPEF